MSNSIDPTHSTHPNGQRHGQINIINHRPGQNLGITPRLFHPIGRLAQNRCHLTTSVRSRDTNMRQARTNTNRFAQADRTPPTDGDDAIGPLGLGVGEGFVGYVGGRVHGCLGEDACDGGIAAGQDLFQAARLRGLFWRREEEGLGEVLAGELGGEFLDGAVAEYHTAWVGVVLELIHGIFGGGGFYALVRMI